MKKKYLSFFLTTLITMSMCSIDVYAAEKNSQFKNGALPFNIEQFGNKPMQYGDAKLKDEIKLKEEKANLYFSFKEGKIDKDTYLKQANKLKFSEDDKKFINNALTFDEQNALTFNKQDLLNKNQISYDIINDKLESTGYLPVSNLARSNDYTVPGSGMIWNLYQYPQETNYYCGASTAKSILGAKGLSYEQSYLAKYDWLETDYWGGTPWWCGSNTNGYSPMRYTLNTLMNTSWYLMSAAPADSALKSNVIYDIDRGYGVASNVYEIPGQTSFLPGHPDNIRIEHWIPIDGYANYGDVIHYAEPVYNASSVSWYKNITNKYTETTPSVMASAVRSRGIVW